MFRPAHALLKYSKTPIYMATWLHVFSYGYWLETELQMIFTDVWYIFCSPSFWDTTDL